VVSLSEPEIIPEDVDRDETLAYGRELEIAALAHNAALRVLRDALAEAEAEMASIVGRNVLGSGKAVNQRQLDYTRGYYDGARFWLDGRIKLAAHRVAQQSAPAGDPRPAGRIDPRTGERVEGDGRA